MLSALELRGKIRELDNLLKKITGGFDCVALLETNYST